MSQPFSSSVRSVVPGRLRVRHPELAGLTVTDAMHLTELVLACKGITGCEVNPRLGSLLITWDPRQLEIGEVGELLNDCQNQMAAFMATGEVASTEIPPEPGHPKSLALRAAQGAATTVLNSAARIIAPDVSRAHPDLAARKVQNRLMLIALGASLAGLAAGLRLHWTAGQIFLGLLACHLYQHRRVL